jgi:hypothetical protein
MGGNREGSFGLPIAGTMGREPMATVPVDFACNVSSGFLMDPNQHQRIGWVAKLDGFGLPVGGLKADLQVSDPRAAAPGKPMVTEAVAGVLETFSWAGGAADPLQFDFYVSQQNAAQLKALQQTVLKNTAVKVLDFIVIDYDPQAKAWFTELAPAQPLTGAIAGQGNPQLNVDLTGTPAKDGIDIVVYKVSIAVSPQGTQVYSLKVSSSSTKTAVKSWGVVVSGA